MADLIDGGAETNVSVRMAMTTPSFGGADTTTILRWHRRRHLGGQGNDQFLGGQGDEPITRAQGG